MFILSRAQITNFCLKFHPKSTSTLLSFNIFLPTGLLKQQSSSLVCLIGLQRRDGSRVRASVVSAPYLGKYPAFGHSGRLLCHPKGVEVFSLDLRATQSTMAKSIGSADDINEFLAQSFETARAHLFRKEIDTTESIKEGGSGVYLCVATGNEAADADSIISALTLAWFEHKKALTAGEQASGVHWIPCVAIPRREFHLRVETKALFERLGINAEHLVFADEIDEGMIKKLEKANKETGDSGVKISLALTDHNRLPSQRSKLETAVSLIIDHHEDSGSYQHLTEASGNRTIAFDSSTKKALAGSCCTLIAERILSHSDTGSFLSPPSAIATLLISVILLDTMNLNPEAKKVTDRDIAAYKSLENLSLIGNPRKELFEWLQGVKFDRKTWRNLSVESCLVYDYKQFDASPPEQEEGTAVQKPSESVSVSLSASGKETVRHEQSQNKSQTPNAKLIVGISSILLSLNDFLVKPADNKEQKAGDESEERENSGSCLSTQAKTERISAVIKRLEDFRKERKLDLLVVMSVTMDKNQTPSRQILFHAKDKSLLVSLLQLLQQTPSDVSAQNLSSSSSAVALQLEVLTREECPIASEKTVAYYQRDSSLSRKQVAPLLIRALEKIAAST